MKVIIKIFRSIYRKNFLKLKKINTNQKISIISMNCIGGVVYHSFNLKFCSPTINLWFKPSDYLKLLNNLEYYLFRCSIIYNKHESEKVGYPVGLLDDINIYFQHYSTFDEAVMKWEERCKRVDLNNLYIIMVQRDGCTEEQIKEFDSLNYKHKVIFTYKDYPQYSSAYCIKNSNNKKDNCVRDLCEYKSKFSPKRYLDDYNWIDFLNIKYNSF